MLQLHDCMKADDGFQQASPPEAVSTCRRARPWLAFTDQVSHAATAGQYQLEQTFLLPVDAMREPGALASSRARADQTATANMNFSIAVLVAFTLHRDLAIADRIGRLRDDHRLAGLENHHQLIVQRRAHDGAACPVGIGLAPAIRTCRLIASRILPSARRVGEASTFNGIFSGSYVAGLEHLRHVPDRAV